MSAAAATATRGPTGTLPSWLAERATIPDPWRAGAALHLRRSWPRSAEHVLLEYVDEHVGASPRVVVGQWMADGARLAHVATAMTAAHGPDAAALLRSHGVVLHRHGVDRRLGTLAGLLDDPAATLVVHRPERRAVVRLDAADGTPPRWAKVVRHGRVAQLIRRAGHLAELRHAPSLLEADHERGLTVWSHLPGVALGELLDDGASALAGTGALLRRLHAVAAPDEPALAHSAADEVAVVTTWLGRLAIFDPATHQRAAPLLGPVAALLGAGPGRRRQVTVHRDVHDGQLLVAASGVTLLDPDTIAAGEPELDLGNLCAHLRLAVMQGRSARGGSELCGPVLDAYGRNAVDSQRLTAYTAAALLRLVGVHAIRPQTRSAVPQLLDEVERLLSGDRRPAGV